MKPFHLVFICSGNRFRSPLAERIVRMEAGLTDISVESFGTLELGSKPALPEAVTEAKRIGIDLRDHHTRPLAGVDLSAADLVVGFERTHVATAVVDAGSARDRTFTLPELVPLLELLPNADSTLSADESRERVAGAAGLRRPDPQLLNLPELADPLRRRRAEQSQIFDELYDLAHRLTRSLFGTTS